MARLALTRRQGHIIAQCRGPGYQNPAVFGPGGIHGEMCMKLMAAMVFLASLPAAAAEPPASDGAAALARLMAVLPGTWKTEGQTFDSLLTKAGPQHYTTQRDC